MSSSVTPREVLAWMAENRASAQKAALHFGMPVAEVRKLRRTPPEPDETRERAHAHNLAVLPTLPVPPPPDSVEADDPGEVTEAQVNDLIRKALRIRLAWLANPKSVNDRNQRDVAIVAGILIDKRAGALEADTATGEDDPADLTTAEGQEAAADALGALPRAVVQKLTAS